MQAVLLLVPLANLLLLPHQLRKCRAPTSQGLNLHTWPHSSANDSITRLPSTAETGHKNEEEDEKLSASFVFLDDLEHRTLFS